MTTARISHLFHSLNSIEPSRPHGAAANNSFTHVSLARRSKPALNVPRSVILESNTTVSFAIVPFAVSAATSLRATDCTAAWSSR